LSAEFSLSKNAELLAAELGKVPNRISVEGHTDAKPSTGKSSYSNGTLSADRANAARRLMQQSGLSGDQISQVRGFADQRLRNPKDSLDPSNRRISIIVQYISNNSDEANLQGENAKGSGEEKPPAGIKVETETKDKDKKDVKMKKRGRPLKAGPKNCTFVKRMVTSAF
jgi:hypothetical protein